MNRAASLVQSITNLFIGIVMVFLGLRFVLRLFNANEANNFVAWVYGASGQLLAPFRGIFPTETIEPGYVIEFSTLFAMVMYGLIGFLILAAVDALRPVEAAGTTTTKKTTVRK